MRPRTILRLAALATLLFAQPSLAQPFTQVIVFGDSNVDSGFYKALANPGGSATYNSLWATAVAKGAGAPTTNPNPMSSQMLAAYFGLTAEPSNTSGGTNYATSGAKNVTVNNSQTGGFGQAIPTVTQMSNYLAAHGGVADGKALYLIYSGDNDVSYADGDSGAGPYPADPTAYVTQAANDLADAVANLHSAGATTIIVAGLAYDFPGNDAAKRALKSTYTNTLWDALTTKGVPFFKGDIDTVRVAINADSAKYGFTTVSDAPGNTACTQPTGIGTSWALLCSSDPGAPSTWVSATAPDTNLFADDGHLATAGQRLMAIYFHNLVVPVSVTHDFNGDAKSDILWRRTNGNLNVWEVDGSHVKFVNAGSAASTWHVVGSGDFDSDGKADILWRNDNGQVAVWLMNGGQTRSAKVVGSATSDWNIVGTGDFDGDGKTDVLWHNTGGQVVIWKMNGVQPHQVLTAGSAPTDWQVIATGDFDGDGKSDILWRNTANGSVAVWLMNGATRKSSGVVGSVTTDWTLAGTGTFDNSGNTDLVWHQNTCQPLQSCKIVIWRMNGIKTPTFVNAGSATSDWQIAGTGDFNRDGNSDILWRNKTSGAVVVWFMTGVQKNSSPTIGQATSDWQIQPE